MTSAQQDTDVKIEAAVSAVRCTVEQTQLGVSATPTATGDTNQQASVSTGKRRSKMQPKPRHFTDVSEKIAKKIQSDLGFKEVQKDSTSIHVHADAYRVPDFRGPGSLALMEFHQVHLGQFGVSFDKNGFEIKAAEEFELCHENIDDVYNGHPTAVVVQKGVHKPPALVVFKHLEVEKNQGKKQGSSTENCKDVPADQENADVAASEDNAQAPAVSAETDKKSNRQLKLTGVNKGQAVAISLAACQKCPLALCDITDGKVHHLLEAKGDTINVWQGLTPQQAYYYIANHLLRCKEDASWPKYAEEVHQKLSELQLSEEKPALPVPEQSNANASATDSN